MNSKNAKINLNVTACPVFSAARPARAKCGPKPDRSKVKLQFSSQFSSIPLILSFCLPLCGCYLLGVPSSPLLLSFPPVLSSLPPSLSPSYYTLTPLPFLPLSFASYSLPLPSSLLFLRLFCSYSSASASASFLCHHLFCFHQHSSRPLQLNSATNSPPLLLLLLPHYLTPIFPGRWATATSYCLSAINYTVPSFPLRFRARPSCCCDRPNTLVYIPGSIGLPKR